MEALDGLSPSSKSGMRYPQSDRGGDQAKTKTTELKKGSLGEEDL
jgi:hypothetical protein